MIIVRVPKRWALAVLVPLAAILVALVLCAAAIVAGSALSVDVPPVEDRRTSELFQPAPAPKIHIIEATAYCACPICCGVYSDGRTASGTWATEGRTIAADPMLFAAGTCLAFEFGHRIVEDTGKAIVGGIVDVYFDTHQAALEFGRRFVSWGTC